MLDLTRWPEADSLCVEALALPVAERAAFLSRAAHARGILHRGLKPASIKLPPHGGVKAGVP